MLALVAACSGGAPAATPGTGSDSTTAATSGGTVAAPTSAGSGASCPEAEGNAWQEGPSADLVELAPGIGAALYPLPEYEARLWSQWGQGIVLPDGRFLSAVGDHGAEDANSFFYEYDPAAAKLTLVGDVLSNSDHTAGDFGYGKIHAQMVAGPCGEVYAATYWGARRRLQYGGSYTGDLLFRLDPAARTIENLGVALEEHGVPSMAGAPGLGLLYLEAAEPLSEERFSGPLLVYDIAAGEVRTQHDDPDHIGFRSIAVDADGSAYYTSGEGSLARYDPAADRVTTDAVSLPGVVLRAAAAPAPDGTVYGVSEGAGEPEAGGFLSNGIIFAMVADGSIRELGPTRGYTTSLALTPDGSTLYYVPGAHGDAWEQGTPLIAVDTASGEEQVVVELNPLAEEKLGLRLGGTYSVAIDPSGSRLFIGFNAAPPVDREAFGQVVLVVVDLQG